MQSVVAFWAKINGMVKWVERWALIILFVGMLCVRRIANFCAVYPPCAYLMVRRVTDLFVRLVQFHWCQPCYRPTGSFQCPIFLFTTLPT